MTREQALKAHAERTRAEIDWATNPHEFRVEAEREGFVIVNRLGEFVDHRTYYTTHAAAEAAICEMICDDDEDKRLNRVRHESPPDESPQPLQCGAKLWP